MTNMTWKSNLTKVVGGAAVVATPFLPFLTSNAEAGLDFWNWGKDKEEPVKEANLIPGPQYTSTIDEFDLVTYANDDSTKTKLSSEKRPEGFSRIVGIPNPIFPDRRDVPVVVNADSLRFDLPENVDMYIYPTSTDSVTAATYEPGDFPHLDDKKLTRLEMEDLARIVGTSTFTVQYSGQDKAGASFDGYLTIDIDGSVDRNYVAALENTNVELNGQIFRLRLVNGELRDDNKCLTDELDDVGSDRDEAWTAVGDMEETLDDKDEKIADLETALNKKLSQEFGSSFNVAGMYMRSPTGINGDYLNGTGIQIGVDQVVGGFGLFARGGSLETQTETSSSNPVINYLETNRRHVLGKQTTIEADNQIHLAAGLSYAVIGDKLFVDVGYGLTSGEIQERVEKSLSIQDSEGNRLVPDRTKIETSESAIDETYVTVGGRATIGDSVQVGGGVMIPTKGGDKGSYLTFGVKF